MKAVLLALFALLILVSNGIKLQNHGDDVLTEKQAQQRMTAFFQQDKDILTAIRQKGKNMILDKDAAQKVYNWMIDDDLYREYLLDKIDQPQDPVFKKIYQEDPKAYVAKLLNIAEKVEQEIIKDKIQEAVQKAAQKAAQKAPKEQ